MSNLLPKAHWLFIIVYSIAVIIKCIFILPLQFENPLDFSGAIYSATSIGIEISMIAWLSILDTRILAYYCSLVTIATHTFFLILYITTKFSLFPHLINIPCATIFLFINASLLFLTIKYIKNRKSLAG
jgi:hypothetical protein